MAGHRWNGTAWVELTGLIPSRRRRWDGFAWVKIAGRRWDGVDWIDLWPPPGAGTGGVAPANLFLNLDEPITTFVDPLVLNLTKEPQLS